MNYDEKHPYDDMINMPHHVSKKHPQMSLLDRAAQFSPFAALTGYEEVIEETARLTDERPDLDDSRKEMLDIKLQLLKEKMEEKPVVKFSYFVPDKKKEGGSFVTVAGAVKKIDMYEHRIFLDNGESILISDLVSMEGDIFGETYE